MTGPESWREEHGLPKLPGRLHQSRGEQGRAQVLSHVRHHLGSPGLWQQEGLLTGRLLPRGRGCPPTSDRARAPSARLSPPPWDGVDTLQSWPPGQLESRDCALPGSVTCADDSGTLRGE